MKTRYRVEALNKYHSIVYAGPERSSKDAAIQLFLEIRNAYRPKYYRLVQLFERTVDGIDFVERDKSIQPVLASSMKALQALCQKEETP